MQPSKWKKGGVMMLIINILVHLIGGSIAAFLHDDPTLIPLWMIVGHLCNIAYVNGAKS